MKHPRLGSLLLLVPVAMAASAVVAPPLKAQTEDPPIAVTWPAQVDDASDAEEAVDPADVDYIPTLGDPILPSDQDPTALTNAARNPDDSKLIYPLGLMAPDARETEAVDADPSTNVHYLSYTYNGAPIVLVGVSADNACHFVGPGAAQCGYGTGARYGLDFKPFIDDLVKQGLNSLRLWVSIVGESATNTLSRTTCPGVAPVTVTLSSPTRVTNDNPFQYAGGPLVNGAGRWWLDSKDTDYFQRLADVVRYANLNNVIVEVTLFSPLTGNIGIGPYGKDHAYLKNGTKLPGFTDTANFTNLASTEYQQMSPYLVNVIHWTVDALYSYPNVYFEVANEPENIQLSTTNTAGCRRLAEFFDGSAVPGTPVSTGADVLVP